MYQTQGSSRPRLERSVTLAAPAGNQVIDPRAGDAIGGRDVPDTAAFDDDSGDDEAGFGHAPTSEATAVPTADGVRYVSRHVSGMS